jgi:hypothetical protein
MTMCHFCSTSHWYKFISVPRMTVENQLYSIHLRKIGPRPQESCEDDATALGLRVCLHENRFSSTHGSIQSSYSIKNKNVFWVFTRIRFSSMVLHSLRLFLVILQKQKQNRVLLLYWRVLQLPYLVILQKQNSTFLEETGSGGLHLFCVENWVLLLYWPVLQLPYLLILRKQNWTFLKETGSDGLRFILICILSLSVTLVLVLIIDTNLVRCHAWMSKTDSVVWCIRTVPLLAVCN